MHTNFLQHMTKSIIVILGLGRLGLVADPVFEVIARLEYEVGLRTGAAPITLGPTPSETQRGNLKF